MIRDRWNFLFGYVKIRVTGNRLETLINNCIHEGIELKNIDRTSNTEMILKIPETSMSKFSAICIQASMDFSIISREGLMKGIRIFRYRIALLVGILVFILAIVAAFSFVWVVDIKGNEIISDEELLAQLKEMGAEPGCWKYGIDTKAIKDKLIIEDKRIAWASLYAQGVRLNLEIVEAVRPPDSMFAGPSNIIASKDCILGRMIVIEGKPVREVGQMIRKNQVLISGVIATDEGVDYVHSSGIVQGRVWYEGSAELPDQNRLSNITGRKAQKRYLKFFDIEMMLNGTPPLFKYYNTIKTSRQLISKNMFLPVEIITEEYEEVDVQFKNADEKEICARLSAAALEKARADIPHNAQITAQDVVFMPSDAGTIKAVAYVETIEDIAMEMPLNIGEQ